jgi:hypothetical protein
MEEKVSLKHPKSLESKTKTKNTFDDLICIEETDGRTEEFSHFHAYLKTNTFTHLNIYPFEHLHSYTFEQTLMAKQIWEERQTTSQKG